MLREFRELTGVGVLLNTSFNRHGLPIIHDQDDAMTHCLNGCVDLVVSKSGLWSVVFEEDSRRP